MVIQDYRRTDLRLKTGGDPFWVSSRAIDAREQLGLRDKLCVVFSFPEADQQIIVREVVVHVMREFNAGVTLEVGHYTLTHNGVESGDTAVQVRDDTFVELDDIDLTKVGFYYPTKGEFVSARGSGATIEGGNLIVGAENNVPAVTLLFKENEVFSGQVRLLLLVSLVPGS